MELRQLLQLFVLLSIYFLQVHSQPDIQDFINIDCGISNGVNYTDSATGLVYTADEQYVDSGAGKNYNITTLTKYTDDGVDHYNSDADFNSSVKQLLTLRSFPEGARNCYTLKPVNQGSKYLVRASFLHGNYDNSGDLQSDPVEFDVYFAVNLVDTIKVTDASVNYWSEIMVVAPANFVSVCLVNKGKGTPFISTLELRPFTSKLYPVVNASLALIIIQRRDLGSTATRVRRYPTDPFDRKWRPFPLPSMATISTTTAVAGNEKFATPSSVLQTAITPTNSSKPSPLNYTWSYSSMYRMYIAMHFAELQNLNRNSSRTFDVDINLRKGWYKGCTPMFLIENTLFGYVPITIGADNVVFLNPTESSTLPPIMNAIEISLAVPLPLIQTEISDIDALSLLKEIYQVERNWVGDPCQPTNFTWDGLTCSNNDSVPPRVTSLNLSSSALIGEVDPSFAKLKALVSLDLSNNNLTGSIPEVLADLPSLQFLNLSHNQLTGVIPAALEQRIKSGALTLSIDDKPNICTGDSCHKKKKPTAIIIAVLSVVVIVILVVSLLLLWRHRSRRIQELASGAPVGLPNKNYSNSKISEDRMLQFDCRQFTFPELRHITNNFETVIGKGGFGNVYHGSLKSGKEVAVKVRSLTSKQGTSQFVAEVEFLSRVHHRNLVHFIGFCKDENCLALVYEYMAGGSLHDYLIGNRAIGWKERIRIAYEAAQGLDYLHRGCNPAIIHRDMKTHNILLSAKMEAKIADLGLSKAFQDDDVTHISTAVAGTRGYIDPVYFQTGQLKEKSDVYGFGVVLLQLITGNPGVSAPDESPLIQWVVTKLSTGAIDDIVDPRLGGQYNPNTAWRIADTAMGCTNLSSLQRPNMVEVVMQLKEAMDLEENSSNLRINTLNDVVYDNNSNSMLSGPSLR